jgi:hypothetical protein
MFFRRRQKVAPTAEVFQDFLETIDYVDALVKQEGGARSSAKAPSRPAAELRQTPSALKVASVAK